MFEDELYLLENWADIEEIDAGEDEAKSEEHESSQVQDQPAAEILQSLEDRQSMHVDLKKFLGEDANTQEQSASDVADLQAELRDEMNYSDERSCGSFRSLVPTKKLECFDESIPFFCSRAACHQRAEHLMPKIKQFVERVRLAEGLLSGTQRVLCLNVFHKHVSQTWNIIQDHRRSKKTLTKHDLTFVFFWHSDMFFDMFQLIWICFEIF